VQEGSFRTQEFSETMQGSCTKVLKVPQATAILRKHSFLKKDKRKTSWSSFFDTTLICAEEGTIQSVSF
jgi:hypothetical protein